MTETHQDSKAAADSRRAVSDPCCTGGTSPPLSSGMVVVEATPIRRRGKSLSRRIGQNGNVFVKSDCKLGRCEHQKSLCPKYGRFWIDQPGRHERVRVVISLGRITQSKAERKLRDHILATGVDSPELFAENTSPATTFKQQTECWI